MRAIKDLYSIGTHIRCHETSTMGWYNDHDLDNNVQCTKETNYMDLMIMLHSNVEWTKFHQ
ncbi:hypothetical protein Lalb_Chr20g0108971 [Lupinus albus]|uniref:Uncharacterized protein n=1 Tax=Lupinus albus TaxID=3870 RepID=A0A6A4NVL2_LUPAL|nr:hypothetical protein Lalb_Chr20g0108971 [Lupinus albus]